MFIEYGNTTVGFVHGNRLRSWKARNYPSQSFQNGCGTYHTS